MARYLVGRVFQAIGVVLAISLITFFILNVIPGDPVELMMGEFATPEAIAQVRAQMGLDKPIVTQYFSWLGNMFQGKAKSDATSIANLSKKPVQVKVVSEDPALSVAVVPLHTAVIRMSLLTPVCVMFRFVVTLSSAPLTVCLPSFISARMLSSTPITREPFP